MGPATYCIPCNAQPQANDHRARYRRRNAKRSASRTAAPPQPSAAARSPEAEPEARSDPETRTDARGVKAEAAAEARPAHVQAAAARWQRITDLNARLTGVLDGEGRALWLALEEALHVHWLDVAVDHYHRGYAAGRAQAWLDSTLAHETSPLEKLRALTTALHEVVDHMQRPAARPNA